MSNLIPSGFKVLFLPKQTSNIEGYADLHAQTCLLYGSPTSLENILALFHEIGHTVTSQGETRHKAFLKSRAYTELNNNHISSESAKIILQEERSAWAFALKNLRSIIGKDADLRSAILYMIHNDLQSYGDDIRESLEQDLVDSVEVYFPHH